ncbi:MAG: hypothetical protein KF878_17815 [Planctomycetes bacterium]|nr:hypothetical protein [Planctomycetota bacterium]
MAPGVWVPWRADHAAPRPRARWSHAMVWDVRRRVVVVIGGRDKEEVFDDQWAWDGAAWREETPRRRPPPRYAAAAGYDEARGRLVLHGGGASKDDRAGHADTWEFDGERWEPRPDAGGPGLRGWHRMAWDPARRRLVLLGGADPRWRAHADLWTWDGARWAALPAGPAPAPPGRHLFGMCWDARRDVLVVYGAQSGPGMDEHWEWHPERGWTRRDDVEGGPGKRHDPGLVAYPGGVLFFGGWDDRRARNDTWSFDGARWTRLLEGVTGDAFLPPGRNWQALVWDAGRGCAVLHGGAASGRGHGDLWELRP